MNVRFFREFKFISLCCIGLILASSHNIAFAAQRDPIQKMEGVTSQVMGALRKNKAAIQHNPSKIYDVVDQYICPHVDFDEMAKWIAGRNAWRKASGSEKQAFVNEFKTLVVRTYATALNNYSDEQVKFLPQRSKGSKSGDRIQISSEIKRNSGESMRVDYRLVARGSDWRVYDLIIEGVSLLKGYRAQFSEDISHKGLSAVTSDIRAHNAKGQ